MPFAELQRKTLLIAVYDFDRISKDDRIGQISIALDSVDFGFVVEKWQKLNSPEEDNKSVML